MGQQIVKQPNGLFAVWSSVVDDFTVVDCTRDELIEEFLLEYRRQITAYVDRAVSGEAVRTQFTKTFDECVAEIRERHGDDAESLKTLGMSG